jgi:hypothetical protein
MYIKHSSTQWTFMDSFLKPARQGGRLELQNHTELQLGSEACGSRISLSLRNLGFHSFQLIRRVPHMSVICFSSSKWTDPSIGFMYHISSPQQHLVQCLLNQLGTVAQSSRHTKATMVPGRREVGHLSKTLYFLSGSHPNSLTPWE